MSVPSEEGGCTIARCRGLIRFSNFGKIGKLDLGHAIQAACDLAVFRQSRSSFGSTELIW